MAGSVGLGFRLVSDENVNKRQELVDLGLEELRNEGSRQVHGEGLDREMGVSTAQWDEVSESHLFVVERVLSELLGRLESVSQEETTEVVDLGAFDQSLDGRGLEVSRFKVFRSSESSAEGSIGSRVSREYYDDTQGWTDRSWPVITTAQAPVG